ncbi:MAG: L-histidine N(alpha)-methyltransferase [Cyanobacteria bacterium P01_D01_bin.14]
MATTTPPARPTSQAGENRLQLDDLMAIETAEGYDVVAGLTHQPKSLPPKYLYDQRGSELFELICDLPEYYPTRTETAILQRFSGQIAHITGACELVELGSGSSTKTRYLFDAYQQAGLPLHYIPVDVSGDMLKASAQQLLGEYPTLSIHGLVSTYEPALTQLPSAQQPTRMIAFLGSTLGNLDSTACDRFLAHISDALQPGDYFLLGVDLHKDTATLEAAYNDSQGITAAFNLNLLNHLNWRFGGNFDLNQFTHVARYNEADRQIEIYLESQRAQSVHLKALNLMIAFDQGERLLSEISRKFELDSMTAQLAQHQLNVRKIFTDDHRWFGLILAQR